MSDKFDDKANMNVRSKLGSHAGPKTPNNGPMVMDHGSKVCKECGTKYGGGDCPMC